MMTKALVANGAAKVYIAGHQLEPLEAASRQLGPQVVPICCDITLRDDLTRAVQTVKSQVGYLNLLICNAGIGGVGEGAVKKSTSPEEFSAKHFAHSFEDFLRPFAVNVAGAWYTSVAFLPLLETGNKAGNVSQSSQVIVIGSAAGLSKTGNAGYAYGQSKAAAIHLAKQLSALLPRWGMRANCITPGCEYTKKNKTKKRRVILVMPRLTVFHAVFPTDLAEPALKPLRRADGTLGNLEKLFPLKRLGNEQDMGGTVLYLASKAGAYTNGAVLVVDGGIMHNVPSVL